MAEANINATPAANNQRTIIDIQSRFDMAYTETQAALAIVDAARVLCALERSPEHHDAHPSYGLVTGGGLAHGHMLNDNTLPTILNHACSLMESAANEFDVMREIAIDAMKGGAA